MITHEVNRFEMVSGKVRIRLLYWIDGAGPFNGVMSLEPLSYVEMREWLDNTILDIIKHGWSSWMEQDLPILRKAMAYLRENLTIGQAVEAES